MKFVLFYHSLTSDWNHGNAHFLRGVVTELLARGHDVQVYEPADGWSLRQLTRFEGASAVEGFRRHYPHLEPRRYRLETLDLDAALEQADVVVVHEWNPLRLLEKIGRHRRTSSSRYRLLFHDTHHRAVSAAQEIDRYPLSDFDGTLAFGETVAEVYRRRGWGRRVWVWHEAADTRVFKPAAEKPEPEGDLVWIGNWGDDERGAELHTFLFEPVRSNGISGSVYGVRYPGEALQAVARSGLRYRGWAPNYEVPELFHRHLFTVHIPRRFYRRELAGIPTIRVFEALACGIPLICAPWADTEQLFRAGRDFLLVRNGGEMAKAMRDIRADPAMARELALAGRQVIEKRHSCRHRVDQLLGICSDLVSNPMAAAS
ncbi:MAG: glycosyltransferase [Woeseia sp.]